MKSVYLLKLFPFFIIACHAEVNLEVIMIADVIHAMEKPSSVIATLCWSLNKKLQLYTALAGKNVTHINMVHFLKLGQIPKHLPQDQHIVFLADLNCPNISTYFEMSSTKNHFRSPFRWILFDSSNNDSQDEKDLVPQVITHIDILPDAEVMVLFKKKKTFYLSLIYKIGTQSTWQREFYGYWNIKNKFQKVNQFIKSTALRRLNLSGHEISVCYVLTDKDSIYHLTDGINDHIDTITKVNFPTTNQLFDFLNASRKYVFADTWGYRENGTWNGMTGHLTREEVEIGGSPMFFTSERMSVVDYISSPTPTRSKFVFQQPKLSYENNLFLLSFQSTVWYSSLGLIFLMFLSLFAVTIWEWKKNQHYIKLRKKNPEILRANITDIVVLIFGAVCQQGSPVELKGTLGRTVMLILFLALMFLYTSYSANIVALLQSSSSQIKTLEDLLHSRLKFGVHDTVFNRYYFSTATEPIRKAIYENKVAPPHTKPRFMSMDEGVKNIQKGLFAFHVEIGVGYKFVGKYFQESEKCGLKEIQYLQVIDPWLAVRKNTPYKEMFKIGLKRIQEHGLQSRENRLLYEKRPKCSGRGGNFVSVSIIDCYPALLILSYGTLLALILFGMEILLYQRQIVIRNIICHNKQPVLKDMIH